MIGEIIEVKTRRGEECELEVISDIGGPEEISTCNIELFFPLFRGRDADVFHAADIRDHLGRADINTGLHHAEDLLKAQWRISEEWKKYELYFPGTILRGVKDGELHIPSLDWGYGGWVIMYHPFWRRDWLKDYHRFVRWKR